VEEVVPRLGRILLQHWVMLCISVVELLLMDGAPDMDVLPYSIG
jgi:hypothetical protein